MIINPYPGLRSFEYTENHLFFGREGQAQEIANRLEKNNFVAVVGTSGSGKSSLVRAGLIPLLYGGRMFGSSSHWRISLMRPGDTPIYNLAESLVHPENFDKPLLNEKEEKHQTRDETQIGIVETILRRSGVGLNDFVKTAELEDNENILIVVDQFEELFRFKEKMQNGYADEATAFVKLLLEATKSKQDRIYIITTMRSDFLGNCAEFRGLPEAINDGQYLISRMTRDQLRSSIESPAKVFDAEVSPVLVNRLLNNLDDDRDKSLELRERMLQDQLPVLQHAMMRTWEEWSNSKTTDEPIDLEHYKNVGGMDKALLNHANEAYEELNDEQKTLTEKLFKCLTEKDEETRETRRPTTVREICAVAGAEATDVFPVIEIFRQKGRTFLMPPPSIPLTLDTKIDISHESLIRNWDVLKKWVKEEAKDAWHYRRLSEDANKWFYKDKDKDFLWNGRVIKDAIKWWNNFAPNQIWASRYQILTDREKRQLNELIHNSSAAEPAIRQILLKRRFIEAKLFLDESLKLEISEQIREKEIRQAQASARYTKWLAGAALLLFGLFGATAYFAWVAEKRGESLKYEKEILEEKRYDLESSKKVLGEKNKLLTEEHERALQAAELNFRNEMDAINISEYTNVTSDKHFLTKTKVCKEEQIFNKGDVLIQECPGYGDYKLEITKTKCRNNLYCVAINVITDADKKYGLNIQKIISKYPSELGSIVAQWRLSKVGEKVKLIGLINAFNIFEDPNNLEEATHYIVISKITEKSICVTNFIKLTKEQFLDPESSYVKARELADVAIAKPCLEDLQD